ncbi:hypothetical protein [Halochromatium salexigens]|uniref:Uncharacterized protein n=1 Tax=Halochromatium salexigens TaxID=49447 RepID=A0AAJ0UHY5_HALSE|nr:hypothetical protein [Halochromatium salexigens]MBK5931656.1 hypothetical protein [Halochromatium salexigens]
MKKKWVLLVALAATFVMVSVQGVAGNKKLMTINAAKVIAERAVVESVVGLKVRSRESVEDLIAQEVRVDAKTAAAIKGIEYTDIVYDPDKDIARVEASIKLGRVSNIVGKNIDFGGQTIKRFGFATSTPAMAGPLQALRAAELDAYKQLAKQIVGFEIDSNTSVRDYLLESDDVRARMMAAIYGAQLVDQRWDEDGNAYVKMRLRFGEVEDVLNQKLNYDDEMIEVEGVGAQVDDFSEAPSDNGMEMATGVRRGAEIREGMIDVPVSGSLGGQGQSDRDNAGGAVDLLR